MTEQTTVATTQQQKIITDDVMMKVRDYEKAGDLQMPPNYSYSNALKTAWLKLQEVETREKKPVLVACSKASITYALMDMVTQGLSPAKGQCYFVPHGNKLTLMRSYMGTVAIAKRLKGIKDVSANIIYEGDEFEYKFDLATGKRIITKHEQSFENIDNSKIMGAYAIVVTDDDRPNHVEIMNIAMIKKAWNQGSAKGNSAAHNNFMDEMCKKTVLNRACKMYVNTSDDSDILIDAFNRTEEKAYDEKDFVAEAQYQVKEEIEEKANQKEIDIVEEPAEDEIPFVDAEVIEEPSEDEGNPPF